MRNEPTHRIRSTFRTRGIALWDRRRSAFGSFDGDPSSSCAEWLRDLGLGQHESAFRANDVDAQVLPRLTAEDLISIGVTSVGHRRRLLDAIVALGAEAPPATVPIPAVAARRQLAVMFCDMVGSTALSARLDPEDYRGHRRLSPRRRQNNRPIRRFCPQVHGRWGAGVFRRPASA